MIIKKLELQGFKSFVDRTKVVFHPGITAIVGPNGTGKSNLVDALLWVLGGRRQKTVRGDRTDDIIFNGNAKRPPVSMADVVLSLGGEDGEMAISHRAFRSGESEYRLDGKGVRLRDIQEELWKHSIGEAEYFVIEQGAIGTFVTSKPNEKRALLEEAAGTAYYKDKKRQAQNKLETSEQNMTRLEDIISEVEKAKNSLQRQASAANRYRRLRERIRELTSFHYLRKDVHLVGAQAEAPPPTTPAWKRSGRSCPASRPRNTTSPMSARPSGTSRRRSRRTRNRSTPSSRRPPAWRARSSGKPSAPSSWRNRAARPRPAAKSSGRRCCPRARIHPGTLRPRG